MLCMFGHPERAAAFSMKWGESKGFTERTVRRKRRAPKGDSKWSKCLLMRKSASLKEEWIIRVVLDSFQLVYRLKIKGVRPFVWVFFSSLRTKCVLLCLVFSVTERFDSNWLKLYENLSSKSRRAAGRTSNGPPQRRWWSTALFIHPKEDFWPCQSIRLALNPFQFFIPLLISFLFFVLINVSSRLWGFLTNHHERLSGILPHFLWVDTKKTR